MNITIKDLLISLLSITKYSADLETELHRLENLIKYAPDMIYWKDKNSIHLGCNDQFAIAAGLKNCEDVVGKSDYDFPWKERANKYINDDKEVVAQGQPKLNIEDIVTVFGGNQITVISNKVPIRDSDGKVIGILGIATDITNQKKMEYELRRSKGLLEELYMLNNIIKYAPDMIYWKDKNSIHLGCNDQFAIAAGFAKREDVIGKSDRDFPWHDQAEKYNADDREVIESGEPRLNIEDTMPFKNGKKAIVITNKVPLRNREGKVIGVLGIATDITHQKQIENDLKIAKESAEAGEQAKTEFIANMSHDIRTPLSGVVGLGSIVEKEVTDPKIKSKIHDMVKSADELLNMLNEILDVVSLNGITVNDIFEEPFDLSHLVQTIIDLEQSSVDLKKIQLFQSIDTKIPLILVGDHKKIHHILLNLVGNSIKFTKTGNVHIKITLSKLWDNKVELLFEISDTGIGIPSESLKKIFELFYKITPSYKGLDKGHGVGLHIVKTYTELLGGKIAVESKLNEGSKFSFSLTLRVADKNTKPKNIDHKTLIERSEDPPLIVSNRETSSSTSSVFPNALEILIIEDNSVARMVAEAVVNQAKCNPTSAIDGETGLELAQTKHFDLILADVGLPGISGTEFAQKLRQFEKEQNKPPVPIVAITGHAEGKMREECLSAGMNEVYIKPIRPEILPEILAKFSLSNTKNTPSLEPQPNPSPIKPSLHGALGIDLPNTEEELFATDNLLIFDPESAKKVIGDNQQLLSDMLKLTLDVIEEELPLLKAAYKEKNWEQVAKISHKLKGGFLNIGLTRAAIACQYLERYHKAGHRNLLEQLYCMVLKVLDETAKNIPTILK